MSDLTPYGTFWGEIPKHMGRVFFVAPAASYSLGGQTYSASDNHRGTDPKKALLTLNRALELCTADADDVILALPGSHVLTASLAMSKDGVTLMGLSEPSARSSFAGRTSIKPPAGDEAINATGSNLIISNLQFKPTTATTAIDINGATGSVIQDCSFLMTATPSASCKGIALVGASNRIEIVRNLFMVTGAQGPAIDATGMGAGGKIEDCRFFANTAGTHAVSVLVGANTSMKINRCSWESYVGGIITIAIDGTGADVVPSAIVTNCTFGVLVGAKPIDNFGGTYCELYNNWKLQDTGGAGGALVTVTT